MPKDSKSLIVALDVGTSKVACLVAELRPDASLEILGMGGHESKGLKKGVVVNIEATVGAIQRAQEDVREPIGMSGVRLEVKVHIVTGAVSAAQNIVKVVRCCGLEVNDLILQPLASSRAVLTE